MRRTRAVVFTALVAASALVLSACGDTGQQGAESNSSSSAPAEDTGGDASNEASASGDSSGEATGGEASGSEAGGTADSGGETAPAGDSACGTPHGQWEEPAAMGGDVTVSFNEGVTSWNTNSAHSNSVYNSYPAYLTKAQIVHYNQDLELINNDSFVTCTLDSSDPVTVTYTVNKAAKWSDDVPVTAADLLLAWVAGSARFNNGAVTQDEEGNIVESDVVAFDTQNDAMTYIEEFPEISEDGQSMTIKYAKNYVDFNVGISSADLPAHVVAMKALGSDDPTQATADMVQLFKDYYAAAKPGEDKETGLYQADTSGVDGELVANMKKVADFWNTGFDFTELPDDPALYLSSGPYVLTEIQKDQFMKFERNPNYDGSWGPMPAIDTITYRIIGDPMAAVQALENQEVDVIAPQSTVDVLQAANALKNQGVEVLTGDGATYEHVDLAMDNGGPFDPETYGGDAEKAKMVRQAFLKTVPRQEIVDKLIKELNPEAEIRQSFNLVPGSPDYDWMIENNGSADWTDVDIEGAKQLLADAGAKNPKVRLMYADNNTRRANEYKIISESAKQAGFEVIDGKNPDWGTLLTDTSKYDAALFGWQSTSTGAGQIPPNYQTGGQNNFYGYSNEESDKALEALKFEPDPEKQKELILTVEKNLYADGFGTVLFQFPSVVAFNSNNIQNVKDLSLAPNYFWNFWEWTAGS